MTEEVSSDWQGVATNHWGGDHSQERCPSISRSLLQVLWSAELHFSPETEAQLAHA